MKGKARYIKLDEVSRRELVEGQKHGKKATFRARCQLILLSDKNYSMSQIMDISGLSRPSVTAWFNRYEAQGITGLHTAKGLGRPPIIRYDSKPEIDAIERIVEQYPQKLSEALLKIEEVTGKQMSKKTLSRLLKKTVGPGSASAVSQLSALRPKK